MLTTTKSHKLDDLASKSAVVGVELVEKEAELGGKAKGWRKSFPTKAPWTDLEDNPIDALIAGVLSGCGRRVF